jgi:hypothetical protein
MRTSLVLLFALTGVLVAGAGASTPDTIVPSVVVNTTSGTLITLKTSELAVMPQQTVTIGATTEQGPTLASLLTYAGVQYNAACRNDELRWWVEVTGADGRAVTLTAGEIDPLFGNRPAILSISEGGQFLTSQGPTLVVPNDPAGRMLKRVRVVTVGRAPAQLASTTPACSPTVALSAAPAAGSILINGDVASPTKLTYSQLQAMPSQTQTVNFLTGSTPTTNTETGPTLVSVITQAKPKFLACDPNDNLRFYAAVTSSIDGYTAVVSWGELASTSQLLSLVENGGSLESVGPRNTVPGDVRGGRYVSGGAVITVFRAPTELPIPSCRTAKK